MTISPEQAVNFLFLVNLNPTPDQVKRLVRLIVEETFKQTKARVVEKLESNGYFRVIELINELELSNGE